MAFSFWKKMFGDQEQASEAVAGKSSAENAAEAEDRDVKIPATKSEVVLEDVPVTREVPARAEEPESDEMDVAGSNVTKEGLESFVSYVACSLVDHPESVSVSTMEKDHLSVIQIRCEKGDIGKIIGKNGKTISAIRLLVSGAGGRIGLRVTVDVLD